VVDKESIPLIGGVLCWIFILIAFGAAEPVESVFVGLAVVSSLIAIAVGVKLLSGKVSGIYVIAGVVLAGLLPGLLVVAIIYTMIFGYQG